MKLTAIEQQMKEIRWLWIRHTIRKPQGAIQRHGLDWNPHKEKGYIKKSLEKKSRRVGESWTETKGLALDRTKWRSITKAQCSTTTGEKESGRCQARQLHCSMWSVV
jgi:hypothetical protein